MPRRFTSLGTDGFGRSDTREVLRRFFEVDAAHVVVAVLHALAADGLVPPAAVTEALTRYGSTPPLRTPGRPDHRKVCPEAPLSAGQEGLKSYPPSDDEPSMESLLRFDTDDPEFARGFEMGILWERINSSGSCHMAISADNAEMVMRVAKATGCQFVGHELDDDQISIELFETSH